MTKISQLSEPYLLFNEWFTEAKQTASIPEPDAMAVATASNTGQPSVRMVLLKEHSPQGFIFYTNYESRKGKNIAENSQVALLFWWQPLSRQIRIEGKAIKVSAAQSDHYFQSRARDSQISACVSHQSETIPSRQYIEEQFALTSKQFQGKAIPRPAYWGGYLIEPQVYEFWIGHADRLNERVRYTLTNNTWQIACISP